MIRSTHLSLVLVVVLALLVSVGASQTGEPDQSQPGQGLTKSNIPPDVMAAFKNAYPNAEITHVALVVENSAKLIEIQSVDGKTRRNLLYTNEGALKEIKEAMNPQDLPVPVRRTFRDKFPGQNYSNVQKVTRDGKVGYMAVTASSDGKHIIVVSEDGKVLKSDITPEVQPSGSKVQEMKETIDPTTLPPQVRRAIRDAAPNENITSVQKVTREGKVGYMAVMASPKGKHVIVVSEDGKVLKSDIIPANQSPDGVLQETQPEEPTPDIRAQGIKENVNPKDLPPQVREAIKQAAPNETLESAQKVNHEGQVGYLVVMSGPKGKHAIVVSENGKILKKDIIPAGQPMEPRTEKKIEKTRTKADKKIEKTKDHAQKKAEGKPKPEDSKKKP